MGTFRLVLAMAVVIAHILTEMGPTAINRESMHILVWSGNAVFAFFIISGFYMSLIVNENYAKLPDGVRRFYLNRALRLYPIHWTILALYALHFFELGVPSFLLGDYRDPLWRWLYAVVSNTFFFGAEVLPFFDAGNWKFVTGPIWSLSIEVYFYVLAPFIVSRSLRTLVILFAAAFAFRMALFLTGVPLIPWRYFFFPANLVLFLMGVLSYRLYVFVKRTRYERSLGYAAAVVLALCVTTPFLWNSSELDDPVGWCFYLCVGVCTPLLFNVSAGWKIDNLLGQLSYPVYLTHVLVIDYVVHSGPYRLDRGVVALVLTLGLSLALYLFIDRPVEHVRRRIKAGAALP